MEPRDQDNPEDPTCRKCGQKLTHMLSLPKISGRPRASLYKCDPCQLVMRIPPED
jgi:hypothetical protein